MAKAVGPGPGARRKPALREKVARHGMIGRPSLLTREMMTNICERIVVGNSLEDSAESLGLNKATAYEWLAKGRTNVPGPDDSDVTFVEFADAVGRSRAECKVRLVVIVRNAAQGAMRKHHNGATCDILQGIIDNNTGAPVTTCRCPELPDPPDARMAARMLESIDKARWLNVPGAEHMGGGDLPDDLVVAESPAERILRDAKKARARLAQQQPIPPS